MITFNQDRTFAYKYFFPSGTGALRELSFYPTEDVPFDYTNWWSVDDEPYYLPDGDDSYVYSNATFSSSDLYEVSGTTDTGTIVAVQICSVAKSQGYAPSSVATYKILATVDDGANIYKSDNFTLTTGYSTYRSFYLTSPATSTSWTWDEIANLQIGVECSSPTIIFNGATFILYPNATGYVDGLSKQPPASANWEVVKNMSLVDYLINYSTTNWGYSAWTVDSASTGWESGDINWIKIHSYCAGTGNTGDPLREMVHGIRLNSTNYLSSIYSLPNDYSKIWYTETYNTNPDTVADWEWIDLTSIEGVLGLGKRKTPPATANARCFASYIEVNYDYLGSPEIRTTQMYVKVKYTPPSVECHLTTPTEISSNRTQNHNSINFWTGEREVYGTDRGGKTLVLQGGEYEFDSQFSDSPCDRVQCVRDMGKDGNIITLSGLSFTAWNEDYRIRSFGWKHVSEKPEYYTWQLELEAAE